MNSGDPKDEFDFEPLITPQDPLEPLAEATSSRRNIDLLEGGSDVTSSAAKPQNETSDTNPDEKQTLIRFAQPPKRSNSELSYQSKRFYRDRQNDSTKHLSTMNLKYPSGLDFEHVVNRYSIESMRERYLVTQTTDQLLKIKNQASMTGSMSDNYSTFDDEFRDSISTTTSTKVPPMSPGFISERRKDKPHPWGYTGRTAIGWTFTIVTGLLTGAISIFLASQTEMIRDFRSGYIGHLWKQDQKGIYIFLAYAGSNLALALLSSMLCLFVAPNAVGSGIPEVKAYLNGVRVQRFSSFRLFFVKVVGTILSVSSDLAIGPEGPLVQIGAIMGASCTKLSNFLCSWFPAKTFSHGFWKFVTIDLSYFATDVERRILVSIGAAAGFSAAFGAPIGGLLFSLEEASTHFTINMFVKTLCATAIATFLLSVYHGNLSDFSIISLGKYQTPDDNLFLNRVEEFPLYLLVAVVGGVMGGLFCRWWKFLQLWRRRFFPTKQAKNRWKLKEVALVSLVTSALMYYIPTMDWPCRNIRDAGDIVKLTPDAYLDHAHQFDCPRGQINELAAIFFGNREDAISDILDNPSDFKPMTLWVTGLVFFFLMTLTLGVAVPSGIFMPTFLIGTSLGGAAGLVFQDWINEDLSPSIFALLGAAALLSGIQRTTVSICVILVEGTGQVKTLIPVIFTVMVARYVGDLISGHGLYELAMEVNQFPFLEVDKFPKLYQTFSVRQIMSSPPLTVSPREKARTIIRLLKESVHNGFPVVDPITKRFLGLVRRDQLAALLECGIFEKEEHEEKEVEARMTRLNSRKGPTGWGSSPIFNLAFHIKDDRYEHIEGGVASKHNDTESDDDDINSKDGLDTSANESATPPNGAPPTATKLELEHEDEFDSNAWFVATRHAREHLQAHPDGISESIHTVEDSMPIPNTLNLRARRQPGATPALDTTVAATVALNQRGNVYISWIDPEHKDSWVPVGDVMNLGTYCVRDTMPVSKAYQMFTELGLRHLVVLGGESGGEVVGVLTRINFLTKFIEERTGCTNLDH
eukprot:CAMPEP_0172443238 /NCGR_PEP_ID=MMETSP1065-20121228/3532_1 /TAXON_ID=265537 /ORGANISM="Amphiprora paludosa, Strain CCMP125" /LENGTH=1034 /DNA_ID=CAMNT_0013193407 /DNA_START=12 /DNA_END=3116 /DNA_ORIENTATION=+